MWRNRLEYLLILLGLLAFYLFFSGYLSFFLLAFFLALPVFSLLFTALSGRKRAVLFTEAPVSAAGGQFALFAELSGKPGPFGLRGRMELQVQNVFSGEERKERLPFFMERGRRRFKVLLSSSHSGLLSCRLASLRIYDPLCLFSFSGKKKKDQTGREASVLVLPALRELTGQERGSMPENPDGVEYAADRPGDDPSELYDIREYRAGDRISRIHWKLSERGEEVYVKEGGLPLDQCPFLAVDPARADDDRAETVLTEAFSLSRHFAFSGVCHRLGILLGQGAEAPSVFSIENPEDFYLALRAVLSARRAGSERPDLLLRAILEEPGISELYYFGTALSEGERELLLREREPSLCHIFEAPGQEEGTP